MAVLRRAAPATLPHQDDAALKAIAQRLEASNRIRTVDDLARIGGDVSVNEISDSAKRGQALRNKIRGKLDGIVKDIDWPKAREYGWKAGNSVAEAHCEGLKKELATRKPATLNDYTVYFVVALVQNELPTPPPQEILETAENLVTLANYLNALTVNDEAARRGYVKAACNIT
jgi:hypothetical protein